MSLSARTAALAQRIAAEFKSGLKTYKLSAVVTPTANWKAVTLTLPDGVTLDADRGLHGSILADTNSSTSTMIVASLARHTGQVTQIRFNVASTPRDMNAPTSIIFVVSGYPA